MNPSWILAACAFGGLLLNAGLWWRLGIIYGNLSSQHAGMAERLTKIEDKLGNGKPAAFLRADRAEDLLRESRQDRDRLSQRVENHETRLRVLEVE